MQVDDAVDRRVGAILAGDVLDDRADVVAEMLAPGGLDAGEDDHGEPQFRRPARAGGERASRRRATLPRPPTSRRSAKTATAAFDSHFSSPRSMFSCPVGRARVNPHAVASAHAGAFAWPRRPAPAPSAATTMPKISNVDSRPSGVTTMPGEHGRQRQRRVGDDVERRHHLRAVLVRDRDRQRAQRAEERDAEAGAAHDRSGRSAARPTSRRPRARSAAGRWRARPSRPRCRATARCGRTRPARPRPCRRAGRR